ncbi:MAG: YwiC-like family protein [Planctomycetaceae bacterium]
MSVIHISQPASAGRFEAASSSTPPDSPALPGSHALPIVSARLSPREHGAYAILGVPLVTALCIVGLTPVTVLLSIATSAAFLAHEPFLLLAGVRGPRARAAASQAGRILFGRLVMAFVCGGAAFWIANSVARVGMIACLLFAFMEYAVSATGNSRTLAAQILALAGLALPSAVVLAAGGIDAGVAGQFLLIWLFGRVATTVSVRAVIAQHKASTSSWALVTCDLLILVAGCICTVGFAFGDHLWLATLPMLLAALVLRVRLPHPKHLKQIGWSLLAVNVVSGFAVVCFMH